jgi:hypothetical protein
MTLAQDSLRPRYRIGSRASLSPIDLHVLQGKSVRNTAQAAGASMAAVYMAKSRVRRLLAREIKALKAA